MKPLTETGYGVVINPGKSDEFFSHGAGEGRFFTRFRAVAVRFKNGCRDHKLRGKVVKMKVTYEVL